ncbi:DUF3906 family protein [Calidifontibacillus erzurumensis]|uniref:DUF3906 family protein n=1 Tax=Calidifontibacillus erzurumensis TaxID=2741433 RepID=A0A8J8KC41_9BACI|nr:DUF3906 family protein [Calidifontibacillus erzurumensis]NSL52237.1 DUF3906 family protein [Calidifontibacillus erzurumensis]
MYLYRFEITLNEGSYFAVVCARDDETAFRLVDVELERHLIHLDHVHDVTLYEKKKIHNGAGFLLPASL